MLKKNEDYYIGTCMGGLFSFEFKHLTPRAGV